MLASWCRHGQPSSETNHLQLLAHPLAGNARVKDCLEEHRDEAGFSSECKAEFETMMEARAADFRLDSSLREKCADDIEDVCGYEKVMGNFRRDGFFGTVCG